VNLAVTFGNFLALLNNDHLHERVGGYSTASLSEEVTILLIKLFYLICDSRAEDPESSIWFEKFERLVAHSGMSILKVESAAF